MATSDTESDQTLLQLSALAAPIEVDALRELCRCLKAGEPVPEYVGGLLAPGFEICLAAIEAGKSARLDLALGLKCRGGVSAARSQLLDRRDAMIIRLWKSLPDWSGIPAFAVARLMRISADRYERARWPRERHSVTAPLSEPSATWWRIMQSGVKIPDVRRIYQILSDDAVSQNHEKTIS